MRCFVKELYHLRASSASKYGIVNSMVVTFFAFCFTSNGLADPGPPLINMQSADHDKHDSDSMEDVIDQANE